VNELIEKLQKLRADVTSGVRTIEVEAASVYAMLTASECYLLNSYYDSIKQPPPSPCDSSGGNVELGPVLHLLHDPPKDLEVLVEGITWLLEKIEGSPLPASRIDCDLWDAILRQATTSGIVADDGTIYGVHTYEQLDPGWMISVAGWLYHLADPDAIHAFVQTPRIIEVPGDDAITIGIVGDWGTGSYGTGGGPAGAVMQAISGLDVRPNLLMHLGDVYYAGTRSEEQSNLLDLWPSAWGPGRKNAFTLNSNHEMYAGANGYYDVALESSGPFDQQNGTSYYAVTFGPWTILGLDSGWYADPSGMYMTGSIGTKDDPQARWISEHFGATQGDHVIVLTHHNPMTTDGTALAGTDPTTRLWDVVHDALGGPPAYWYFGHVHNGVVYGKPSKLGTLGTKARLCGHGAIPYGAAWGLEGPAADGIVEYYAHTPIPNSSVQVENGFATIRLEPDGGITETFYELRPGGPIPVWPS
jgi:hypothetical protein